MSINYLSEKMERKLFQKVSAGFLLASIVLGQNVTVSAMSGLFERPAESVMTGQETGLRKTELSQAHKKIPSELLKLIDADFLERGENRQDIIRRLEDRGQYVTRAGSTKRIRNATTADLAYVYVTLDDDFPSDVIDDFLWNVTNRDDRLHLIVAYVEIGRLEPLAEHEAVRSIRTVNPPRVHKGSVTAESDAILKTATVRSTYGAQGGGIKIGVISDGVDHLSSAKTTGDLPSDVNVLDNSYGGEEGTAMLEIIYDMAPGAALYFHAAGDNMLSFNQAVDDLISAGCKIIVDDLGYDEESFFEDGVIGNHMISIMESKDVIFVSAGGNEANVHYQGIYYDDGSGSHDFSRGTSGRKYLYANLESGDELDVVLQWDEKFGESSNDFDLYLFDDSTGAQLAASEETQDGTGDPLEIIYYTNDSSDAVTIRIEVISYDAAADKALELYAYPTGNSGMQTYNMTTADSIYGHAGATGVMTVGAISAQDPGNDTIEYYSSRGPMTIIGEGLRAKPDIVGIDEVSVTGAGDFGSPFSGTSAAAPTIAAIAGQLWGAFPNLKGSQIKDAIYDSAVDLGTAGFDYTYGNGRADALRAYQLLAPGYDSTPPVITLKGDPKINLIAGESYIEQGAIATDNLDGTISVTIAGSVDTSIAGTYEIMYSATDRAGNTATAIRTVTISTSDAKMIAFDFLDLTPDVFGIINETSHDITLTVPFATNVTALVPTIKLPAGATVSPASGIPQDFSVGKTYTVTSASGSRQAYTVRVGINNPPPISIVDGDIVQCKNSSDPFAVYIVKVVGGKRYIRHIVSLEIFGYYKHLRWENLKQVDSLETFSLSGWIRVNTGPNGQAGSGDKVWEVNGDQTKHWINMTASQFLAHGGSDEAIYTVNQGELELYRQGPDVMSL